MPMPVSVTPICTWRPSTCISTLTVTEPDGVNFTALLTRFTITCFTFARSLFTWGTPSAMAALTTSRVRAIRGSSSASTSWTRAATSIDSIVSGIRPASMREMSRMSLMSASRCCAFESTRPRLRCCLSLRGPETPSSSRLV